MGLRLVYEGEEVIVPDGQTAVIGSDPNATMTVARPGISRRHATVKNDGATWVVQDAASRNGTYHQGARIESLDIAGQTTIRLGHPTDGPLVELAPTESQPAPAPAAAVAATRVVPRQQPPSEPAPIPAARPAAAPSQAELDRLIRSLDATVRSVKGLTWSVWAMIAVTAVLALLTLFVGIVAN